VAPPPVARTVPSPGAPGIAPACLDADPARDATSPAGVRPAPERGRAAEAAACVVKDPYWLHPIEVDHRCGFIDRCGRIRIPAVHQIPGCRHHRFRSDSLLPVRQPDGRLGYLDATGRFAIPARFAEAGRFSEGLAPVREIRRTRTYGRGRYARSYHQPGPAG
jgi:hypothetical protein